MSKIEGKITSFDQIEECSPELNGLLDSAIAEISGQGQGGMTPSDDFRVLMVSGNPDNPETYVPKFVTFRDYIVSKYGKKSRKGKPQDMWPAGLVDDYNDVFVDKKNKIAKDDAEYKHICKVGKKGDYSLFAVKRPMIPKDVLSLCEPIGAGQRKMINLSFNSAEAKYLTSKFPAKVAGCSAQEDGTGNISVMVLAEATTLGIVKDNIRKDIEQKKLPASVTPKRAEEMIKEMERIQKLDPNVVQNEGFKMQTDFQKTAARQPWIMGAISLVSAIVGSAIGAVIMSKIFKKANEDLVGGNVTVADLTHDVISDIRKELAQGGRAKHPYIDDGTLDRMFDVMRNDKAKYNNFSVVGETDAGKTYSVEHGLAAAIAVEEYIMEHPGEEALLLQRGYPCVPEQHRDWVRKFITHGKTQKQTLKPNLWQRTKLKVKSWFTLGRGKDKVPQLTPEVKVVTLDMRAFKRHGAVFKGKEDIMIEKFVAPYENLAKSGTLVVFFIDESKEAAERGRTLEDAQATSSLMDRLKKVAESHENFVLGNGTTTEEYTVIAEDRAQTTRFQAVYIGEAMPVQIFRRLKMDPSLASEYGVTSVTNEALQAIFVMCKKLKPSASYNASANKLLTAVASYAKFKNVHEITYEFFEEYYQTKHGSERGPLELPRERLTDMVDKIGEGIKSRTDRIRRILNEFQEGNVTEAGKRELKAIHHESSSLNEGGGRSTIDAFEQVGAATRARQVKIINDFIVRQPAFMGENPQILLELAETAYEELARMSVEDREQVAGNPELFVEQLKEWRNRRNGGGSGKGGASGAPSGAGGAAGGGAPPAGSGPAQAKPAMPTEEQLMDALREHPSLRAQFRGLGDIQLREEARRILEPLRGLSEIHLRGVMASAPLEQRVAGLPLSWVKSASQEDRPRVRDVEARRRGRDREPARRERGLGVEMEMRIEDVASRMPTAARAVMH